MSNRHLPSDDGGERGSAIERLQAAVGERVRAHEALESADGTPDDVKASAALQAAEEHVTARERWLEAVDDHDY